MQIILKNVFEEYFYQEKEIPVTEGEFPQKTVPGHVRKLRDFIVEG